MFPTVSRPLQGSPGPADGWGVIDTEPRTLDEYRRKVAALEAELDDLRQQIDRLDDEDLGRAEAPVNVYVFDDDDEEARAFDDFYRAYDRKHAKTRRFLLG